MVVHGESFLTHVWTGQHAVLGVQFSLALRLGEESVDVKVPSMNAGKVAAVQVWCLVIDVYSNEYRLARQRQTDNELPRQWELDDSWK